MDEYQNYEKAYGALSEAYKFLSKAKSRNATQQEERLATLKQKMGLIKKFMQAKKIYDEDPEESLRQCQIIIDDPEAESAIRIGDVFGFMIEHNARAQDYNQAYNLMQELRQRIPSVNMAYYISMRTIESIHKALGIPLGRGMGGEFNKNGMINGDDIEDGEIVDEEVPDEAYDAQDDDYI